MGKNFPNSFPKPAMRSSLLTQEQTMFHWDLARLFRKYIFFSWYLLFIQFCKFRSPGHPSSSLQTSSMIMCFVYDIATTCRMPLMTKTGPCCWLPHHLDNIKAPSLAAQLSNFKLSLFGKEIQEYSTIYETQPPFQHRLSVNHQIGRSAPTIQLEASPLLQSVFIIPSQQCAHVSITL